MTDTWTTAPPEKIIVTRHKALIQFLQELDITSPADKHIEHVSDPDQIEDKHVIGVLPLYLAALAAKMTEIRLDVPPEHRGRELSLEQVRKFYAGTFTYVIRSIPT